METNTITLPGHAKCVKKTTSLKSLAIVELKRIKEQDKGPLSVYSTFGGFWAVEYRGLAKVRLTLSAMIEELTYLREFVYVMPPEDFKEECLERGWVSTTHSAGSGQAEASAQ